MNRLRNRLLAAFLFATLIPLSLSLWLTSALLERSLLLSTTREIDELSKALKKTGRELYEQSRDYLKIAAETGKIKPDRFALSDRQKWPEDIAEFWNSREAELYDLTGEGDNRMQLLVRKPDGIYRYSKRMGSLSMSGLAAMYSEAQDRVDASRHRDWRRGFLSVLLLVGAAGGVLTVAVLIFFAHRISRPVHKLTDAITRLAAGEMNVRVETGRRDEIGAAFEAFNHMAEQLQQSRERLILLTRLSSWQALGRKMAHEVKNSLTPIRLTVEEMAARRHKGADPAFFEQASAIIVDEVTRLEKRVRAFSDLAAEPPVHFAELDVNLIVEERIGFLRTAHPDVIYDVRLSPQHPRAKADEDLVRGVLTNLLENAAEAAGPGGVVLGKTALDQGKVAIEVHDSGPGLSLHARETLFQPTISFKKTGMGLGLSIARKSAMLSGGDIEMIDGELGGAAFRVTWAQSES